MSIAKHPTDRPNILFICTDQQRYDTLGCYDNPHIHTPTLDRLAAEGVRFSNCYVQNPVCSPSRASLLTSRYVRNHGLWANGVALPPGEQLFTKVLADSGYDCGLVGKFHLSACYGGRTEPRLNDGFRVFRWAHDPYPGSSENEYHRWLRTAHPDLWEAARDPDSAVTFDTMPTEAHYSRWVANETIDFLRRSREKDKPFFFVTNFFDPHHGFGAPKEYVDRYRSAPLPEPVSLPDELATKPAILTEASQHSYSGHARGYRAYTKEELHEIKAAYYGMISLIDDEVHRILTTLEAEGLAENTIVVFTSDHGEMLGDHQLMLKGPMQFDCSVRVPLIMRWPGVLPAGETRTELVQWVDLAPTFLEAAGAPPLPRGQGESLLRLARGEPNAWTRDWALSEYRDSGHPYDPPCHTTMLRHDRWKLIVHHGPPATDRARDGELYDLESDPHELHNLWHDPPHARTKLALYEKLVDVLVATEDRSQERVAFW